MKIITMIARTWFTGLLYCLAGCGYVFYGFLYCIRIVQTKKITWIIAAGLVFAAVAGAVYHIETRPPGPDVELVVAPGTPVRTVARRLAQNRVVWCAPCLRVWLRVCGTEKRVQAGRYMFRENDGIIAAARKLRRAEPLFVSVTIPEGLTIEETASRCAGALGIDSAAFVQACTGEENARRLGVNAATLEGYLFPDTYRFDPHPSPDEVVRRLVRRFEEVYAGLARGPVAEKYTREQIVTLASIIEKEAALAEERPHISGVFHNRLRRGIALGADPTVRYALRKFSGPLRVSELNNPSPYNTRVHRGLPPGPICSPGRASIEAALFPVETNDMYFVARWDGSGGHDFSVTNAEHDRKKQQIRRSVEMRKQQTAKEQP